MSAACDTGPVTAPTGDQPSRYGSMWTGADWSDPRAVAEWWYRPVVERRTWNAVGYLAVGIPATLAWFVATVVVLAISLPLVLVAVGLVLCWFAFGLIDAMAGVERRRASWIDVDIEPRRLRVPTSGPSRLTVRLGDPARWRQVGYMLAAFVVAGVAFGVAATVWVTCLSAATAVLGGGGLGSLVQMLAGVAALGAAPRVTVMIADLYARFTAWLLGPDPLAEMQDRVDTLSGQRSEILDAVADERRRIERNLHDGAQQRLVALGIDLGMAASKLDGDPDAARALVEEAREKARASLGELRGIGRGLHPAILEDRGLDAALSAVVADAAIPISLDVPSDLRLPIETEETAYFIASEAVTNMMKHSGARAGAIRVEDDGDRLRLSVYDDGCGGADVEKGTGLAGIAARVHGRDGTFDLSSPEGGPTILTVELGHG